MCPQWNRREILKGVVAASATWIPSALAGTRSGEEAPQSLVEVQITPISPHTFRLSLLPLNGGSVGSIPSDGSLAQDSWGTPVVRLRSDTGLPIDIGNSRVTVTLNPVTISVRNNNDKVVQRFVWDDKSRSLSFLIGDSSLFGLGEGGPQYDRGGSVDSMRNGQDVYKLETHGSRVPIPWIIGTSGWAIFFHQPHGTIDLARPEGKFLTGAVSAAALAIDLFVVVSRDPATIMAEYVRITGHPEMPPLWSLGYQQSHRTLSSREEILGEAKTFREKKLPCDVLIFLGTGFCPSGWNTENGSFVWNSRVFPDPKEMLTELHSQNFRVVPHVVILSDRLRGTVHDRCDISNFDESEVGCYWDVHRKDFSMGIDGWWPDEGDPLDAASRLVRNRMYWEGPQLDRPNERPYSLHRNGYAGMQRYASFLWSGDVYSTWETLRTQIPIALNTALSGISYWGTDIGGFVPTAEFTAELYVRWFQFGAFCPLFRCHGRTWKLRLPWGWNTGDPGPVEVKNYDGAATPDASQLHDARVEQVCRKYLELRYRMLPYLYSVVRECAGSGMPIMRALWLHFPEDPEAVKCRDQYLWGGSLLVAPVVEKGATVRAVYLPRGIWYDFWTGERQEGGGQVRKSVDLETMPLYVRAGSILPLGPVRQFTGDKTDESLSITIYPGADGSFLIYEDDGTTFNYRQGEWMGIQLTWNDSRRTLHMQLAPGSRMLPPGRKPVLVRLGDLTRNVTFEGTPVEVTLQDRAS